MDIRVCFPANLLNFCVQGNKITKVRKSCNLLIKIINLHNMNKEGFYCVVCHIQKVGVCAGNCFCKMPLCENCTRKNLRCHRCKHLISCGRCGKVLHEVEFITCKKCNSEHLCKTCRFDDMCFPCYTQENRANVQFFKDIILFQQTQLSQLITNPLGAVPALPEPYVEFLRDSSQTK